MQSFACWDVHSYISISLSLILPLFFFTSIVGRLEQEETRNVAALSDVDFRAGLFPGRNRARHGQQLYV